MQAHRLVLSGLFLACSVVGLAQGNAVPQASAPHVRELADADDVRTLREELNRQEQEIQSLRQQLQEHDQQWREMIRELEAAIAGAQPHAVVGQVQTPAAASDTQPASVALQNGPKPAAASTILSGKMEDQVRTLSEAAQRFRFAGDVRLRQEDLFQSSTACVAPKCDPRIRELLRVRFGVESRLNQDFLAGIYLASGAVTNPTSTNETFTGAFERKTFALDRGYIVYNPVAHKWLSLTGGKFTPVWQRTTQTFDPDLNPDGFTERASLELEHAGVLKNLNVTGIQLFFNEVSHGPDSYAEGGQVGAKLEFGGWTSMPSYTFLDWHRPDVLLNEPPSVTGAANTGPLAPNAQTNSTRADAGGILHFTGGFFYSDFILDNNIRTPWSRFPLRLLGEYETNLAAAAGNRNRHLYQVVAEVGRAQEKHDVLFGYGWNREEQDAAIASFVESEQRAPTNILQHRLYAQYSIARNVSFLPSLWIGRTLNSRLQNAQLAPGTKPGEPEPYMKHVEFDLIYKF